MQETIQINDCVHLILLVIPSSDSWIHNLLTLKKILIIFFPNFRERMQARERGKGRRDY